MWVPVHDEEWDGDVPVQAERTVESTASSSKDTQAGQVVFKGDVLPWKVGTYEVRTHTHIYRLDTTFYSVRRRGFN
jgi:phosphatidylethanolamine N-methyltransferase